MQVVKVWEKNIRKDIFKSPTLFLYKELIFSCKNITTVNCKLISTFNKVKPSVRRVGGIWGLLAIK